MNTNDLIKQLSLKLNITQKEARRLLYQELDAIALQLSEGNNVIIRGFGTFGLRNGRTLAGKPVRKTVFLEHHRSLKTL